MSDWEDPLWVDNRAATKGAGTHAFIVGTSYYPFLKDGKNYPPKFELSIDLKQVSIAATGAWKFANWLTGPEFSLNAKAPLASIRLMLSPSEEERSAFPELKTLAPKHCSTERENVRSALMAWKEDCQKNGNSVAIFYVSGHGVARSPLESYVLLQDFPKDKQETPSRGANSILSMRAVTTWRSSKSSSGSAPLYVWTRSTKDRMKGSGPCTSAPVRRVKHTGHPATAHFSQPP